jgi:hypothetical protein
MASEICAVAQPGAAFSNRARSRPKIGFYRMKVVRFGENLIPNCVDV